MISAKSRQHKENRDTHVRRKHSNKKFYNSKAWRETREAYMRFYRNRLYTEMPKLGRFKDQTLTAQQVTYLLSLDYLPCETCLRLYIANAYDSVQPGEELDHIIPVNPNNALEISGMSYGDPFEFNNLQLLCRRHHSKKSQRER